MLIEKLRTCLICRVWFQSASPANRICKKCKKSRKNLRGGVECVPIGSLAVANPYRMMANFEAARAPAHPERERPVFEKTMPVRAVTLLGLDLGIGV